MSEYLWKTAESSYNKHKRRKEEQKDLPVKAPAPRPQDVLGCEERLPVQEGCAGLIIGKKGENIKRIQQKLNVTITLSENPPEVIVRGMCHDDVEQALFELDFARDKFEVPSEAARFVCGKGRKHLQLLQRISGLASLNFHREREDDEDSKCWLELIGRRESLEDARLCLDVHLSYYNVFTEMERVEEQLNSEMVEAGVKKRPSDRPTAIGGSSAGNSAPTRSTNANADASGDNGTKGRKGGKGGKADGKADAGKGASSIRSPSDKGSKSWGKGTGKSDGKASLDKTGGKPPGARSDGKASGKAEGKSELRNGGKK